eukprot:2534990-Alexandrium_andersonii.AAC.1
MRVGLSSDAEDQVMHNGMMAIEDVYDTFEEVTGAGAASSVQSPSEQVISRSDLRATPRSLRDSWEHAREFRMM